MVLFMREMLLDSAFKILNVTEKDKNNRVKKCITRYLS
jgi:hypothetical protein